jgi:hypothetical protein
MTSGYYVVKYPTGKVPVWLTNINGTMYHYQQFAEKWEVVSVDRITKEIDL